MKKIVLLLFVAIFASCDYIKALKKEEPIKKNAIAKANNKFLYEDDIKELFPVNYAVEDSLVIVQSFIKDWALKELMLQRSQENVTKESFEIIDQLVTKYKESLLINNYKERLIKQQLDTIVSNNEITDYYQRNEQNFKLNETLIQIKYIHINADLKNEKKIIKAFQLGDIKSVEYLQMEEFNFQQMSLNDSVWQPLDNVMLKIPISRDKLIKKSKFIEKENAIDLYLVAVKDVLNRGDIAPKGYITSTIKQLVLHKRKLELVREIEKIILKDATQNKSFETY
jgi:hypothetical protein